MAGKTGRGPELADDARWFQEIDLAFVLAERNLAHDQEVEGIRGLPLHEEDIALAGDDGIEEPGHAPESFVAKVAKDMETAQLGRGYSDG
jgi:hypothetical protein